MRVLIATGGPGQTEIGIRQLIVLAETMPLTPTVLTVIKHAEEQAEADQILAHAAQLLEPALAKVNYITRVGQPWEEIVQEAESGGYDLLMMGQRQSRPLLTRIRGLVTQKVVAHAMLPVLIAKREARPLQRALICDSGAQSPSLLQLFRMRLPALLAGVNEVTVLHVMSQISAAPGIKGDDLRATAEELIRLQTPEGTILGQDLATLGAMNLTTHAKVRHGLVVDEIAKEARSDEYDLVVIGAHRDEGLPRFLLDDLSHELVLDVERAILVVR
ncbi:MAG: universal stress protein [Candidatus Promineofilum sp.]|nr:universal stress protein [Promineifilum sp.]